MSLVDQNALHAFLNELDLRLVQSEKPDPVRGSWIIVDTAGEVWSGPFLNITNVNSWLLEHCGYVLIEEEKLQRFIHAYESASSEGKASLEADLYQYRIGIIPKSFPALFKEIGPSSTTLPPDWQDRAIRIMRDHPDQVGFERRAAIYLSRNPLQ